MNESNLALDRIDVESKEFKGFTREVVEELSRRKGEPDWMRTKRLRAWMLYEEVAPLIPPASKRTDLSGLKLQELQLFTEAIETQGTTAELVRGAESISTTREVRSGRILQSNGVRIREELNEELARKNVIFTDMNNALSKYPDLVQRYFMTDGVQINDGKFVSLHAALWGGGTFLYVPKNVTVEFPLQSDFLADKPNIGLFPHTLVVAEARSTVTLIDNYTSPTLGGQALISGAVEIFAGEASNVQYIALQELGQHFYNFNYKRAIMKKDSSLTWVEIALGGKVSRSTIEAILKEQGSSVELLGLYFASKDQQMEFDTVQTHVAPHTKSDLLYKGALRDKARTVFEGLIRVNKTAQKTDAYQANRNLLLGGASGNTRADSIPKLEIEANDVRCTHGATVGQIDKEGLFYLMSRGLSHEDAVRLLLIGFFDQIIQRIPVEDTREQLLYHIEQEMSTEQG